LVEVFGTQKFASDADVPPSDPPVALCDVCETEMTPLLKDMNGETIQNKCSHCGHTEDVEKMAQYAFVNEDGRKINLNWDKALKLGSLFERPDTGNSLRVAGYVRVRYATDEDLYSDLMDFEEGATTDQICPKCRKHCLLCVDDGGVDSYYCPACGFDIDGVDYNNQYGKQASAEKPYHHKKTDSPTSHTAADISDEVPPMGWTTQESKHPPKNAPAPLPQKPELVQAPPAGDVIYDSKRAEDASRFQTTVNPEDRSVTVKFLGSPQEEALQEAVAQSPTPPQVPNPAPTQPLAKDQTAPKQEFSDQEIPVQY